MLIFQLLAVATSIEEMRFGMNEMLMSTPFSVFRCASIAIRFVFFRNIFEEELGKRGKMLKSVFSCKTRYDLVNKHVWVFYKQIRPMNNITVRWEKALKPQFASFPPFVTPETCLPHVHVWYANKIIFVALKSYALKNKQDAVFQYRSVFDVFIYKKRLRSQSRSVLAWTLCTHASASSSLLIRVMNKRWWMAKKKIKFQLVACIKESDGKQTGEKLLFFPTFGQKRHVENEYLHLQTRLFVSSKKSLDWISSRGEKNCRRFSESAIYDASLEMKKLH